MHWINGKKIIGCFVYTINPECRKLQLACIDMYDKFKSIMGKYDFVSMLFLNINFKKLYGSIKEMIKYLKKYLSVCQ